MSAYINGMYRNLEAEYVGHAAMRATHTQMKSDIADGLDALLSAAIAEDRDAALAVAEEFQAFNDDLVEQTPWHEPLPSDPPLHAAEVWKNEFYPNATGFTMTIYNPKHYMPFLEDGWSPQAPAGWIAAAWTLFVIKTEARLG